MSELFLKNWNLGIGIFIGTLAITCIASWVMGHPKNKNTPISGKFIDRESDDEEEDVITRDKSP